MTRVVGVPNHEGGVKYEDNRKDPPTGADAMTVSKDPESSAAMAPTRMCILHGPSCRCKVSPLSTPERPVWIHPKGFHYYEPQVFKRPPGYPTHYPPSVNHGTGRRLKKFPINPLWTPTPFNRRGRGPKLTPKAWEAKVGKRQPSQRRVATTIEDSL